MGVEVAALLIAGLFVASGFGHIRERAGFVATLRAYRLLPTALAPWIAVLVIVVELGASLLVVATPSAARIGLLTFTGIAVAGAILIAFDLTRGNRWHGCGCLGAGTGSLSWWLVLRGAVIAVGTASVAALLPDSSTTPKTYAVFLLLALTAGWTVVIAASRLGGHSAEIVEE